MDDLYVEGLYAFKNKVQKLITGQSEDTIRDWSLDQFIKLDDLAKKNVSKLTKMQDLNCEIFNNCFTSLFDCLENEKDKFYSKQMKQELFSLCFKHMMQYLINDHKNSPAFSIQSEIDSKNSTNSNILALTILRLYSKELRLSDCNELITQTDKILEQSLRFPLKHSKDSEIGEVQYENVYKNSQLIKPLNGNIQDYLNYYWVVEFILSRLFNITPNTYRVSYHSLLQSIRKPIESANEKESVNQETTSEDSDSDLEESVSSGEEIDSILDDYTQCYEAVLDLRELRISKDTREKIDALNLKMYKLAQEAESEFKVNLYHLFVEQQSKKIRKH